jgi:ATP-dependent RNA helicase DeaD
MLQPELASIIGTELFGALAQRGFTELTSVQEAVLDPLLQGRDLRVTSQTGSGKTVALGLALRELVRGETAAEGGAARPRALVVAPTRELAHQVEQELTWLYAPLGVRVVTTTGGSSARDERRALGTGPAVIVGTPGRLLDHLSRKSINPSQIAAVVLDEADRMLDLGFREDLRAILGYPPPAHRTHLVSATFPHAVRSLADSVQDNPAHVQGTRLGAANVDIVHRIILVDPKEQVGAVVNILLAHPDEQALVFARTRADVASLSKELAAAKFAVGSLSGEMDQVARNRAMSAFKKGTLRVLVATDVAARGIDVQDIAHVIHADAPGDADTYTHRSGRTGRAGRKGTSSVLVTQSGLRQASFLLTRAGVAFRVESVPSADDIRRAADERFFAELTAATAEGAPELAPRITDLAGRLAGSPDVARTVARLLARVRSVEASEPRDLRHIEPPAASGPSRTTLPRAPRSTRDVTRSAPVPRPARSTRDVTRPETTPRPARSTRDVTRPETTPRPARSTRDVTRPETTPRPARSTRDVTQTESSPRPTHAPRKDDGREWTAFHVTWGSVQGADARRLLAIVCRRGGIRGTDVGAIRVGPSYSTVDVASEVAREFAEKAKAPDPREPKVIIRPDRPVARSEHAPRPATHGAHAPRKPTTYERAPRKAPAPRPAGFKGDGFKRDGYKGKRPDAAPGGHAAPRRPKP